MWLFVFTQSATFHNKVEPIIIFYSPYWLWHTLKNKIKWRVCKEGYLKSLHSTESPALRKEEVQFATQGCEGRGGLFVSDWSEEVCAGVLTPGRRVQSEET